MNDDVVNEVEQEVPEEIPDERPQAQIIQLRPDMTDPNSFPPNVRDMILIENRDDMLEFLDGIRGRIMAFDIRGLVMIGFAQAKDQDITYASRDAYADLAYTVGTLEFLKSSIIHERIADIEEDFEEGFED